MAKSNFHIVAIKLDMETKYREFWDEDKTVSTDGTPLHPAILADTDLVEARSLAEAKTLAGAKFPCRTLIVSSVR